MSYVKYGVKLSTGQKEKLAKALSNKSAITIRLTKSDLTGNDELMLTRTQLKRIQKAMKNGTGVDLKISKTQIRHLVKVGGSLWGSLMTLGAKALPYATAAASKALPALATGALSGLASMGVNKIFGSGQRGGFLIPQNRINQLIKHKDLLTKAQKEQIVAALHTGGRLIIKPTKTQSGGFLGTVLASIGVPLLMNALTGSGLQVDRKRSRGSVNVHVPRKRQSQAAARERTSQASSNQDGGLFIPMNHITQWRSPPFVGTWDNPVGMGIKKKAPKKKRQRVTTREKQSIQGNSIAGSTSVKFVNKPLSNFDLQNWVKQLGIKHFRGVYSRDALPTKIRKECGIINLDSQIGPGTHWVAYRNIDNFACEYFDSFGLIMPTDVQKYLSTSGKQIFYSGDEIQERDSVLCGYWCLYYLLERQKGVPMLNVIHNAEFDMKDKSVNHRFIINYFKNWYLM